MRTVAILIAILGVSISLVAWGVENDGIATNSSAENSVTGCGHGQLINEEGETNQHSRAGEGIIVSFNPETLFVVRGPHSDDFHQTHGTQDAFLPVAHVFQDEPACYIACYSHNPQAVYPVTPSIYVNGLIKLQGKYEGRICHPQGHEYEDISAMQVYKSMCNKHIKTCTNGACWAGGDTGGFF